MKRCILTAAILAGVLVAFSATLWADDENEIVVRPQRWHETISSLTQDKIDALIQCKIYINQHLARCVIFQ